MAHCVSNAGITTCGVHRLSIHAKIPEPMVTEATPGRRLLVVDDNEDNRDMLARRLRRRGFEVITAESGAQALELISSEQSFDAVLLDVMMPNITGLEVLAKLRTRWTREQLPVLMATAKSDSEDVVEALRLGANDYVTKPINLDEVISALAVALDGE